MHLIIGGRCQGKLQFAKGIYGETLSTCDLVENGMEEALSAGVLLNLQEWVKRVLIAGDNPCEFCKSNMDKLAGKVLIGDEIGCGIVPIDALEREWRDETGRVYQFIVSRADRVDRVWAGIGQRLK